MQRQHEAPPLIISSPLLAASAAAHSLAAIHERDWLAVLAFPVLDGEGQQLVEGIDWQSAAHAITAGVAK